MASSPSGSPRAGDVKGFVSSECDADLERVLAQSFGLKVKVRAVSGPPRAGPARARRQHRSRSGKSGKFLPNGDRRPARAEEPEPARGHQPRPRPIPEPPRPVTARATAIPSTCRDPEASAGDDALTGVDLIKRELGGQVVDETDNG